jgi:hypothetical protein
MTTCRRPFSLLVLILTVLVLHSNKMITSTHACYFAKVLAEETLRDLPCEPSYTCSQEHCLTNFDGEGGELAGCVAEAYCTIDGAFNGVLLNDTCATLSVTGGYKLATGYSGTTFSLRFFQGLTGKIRWSISEDAFLGDFCSIELNDNPCSDCYFAECPGTDGIFRMQADCSNLDQGYLNLCDEEAGGNPGDFLVGFFLPGLSTCGQAPQSIPASEDDVASDDEVVNTGKSQTKCSPSYWYDVLQITRHQQTILQT